MNFSESYCELHTCIRKDLTMEVGKEGDLSLDFDGEFLYDLLLDLFPLKIGD